MLARLPGRPGKLSRWNKVGRVALSFGFLVFFALCFSQIIYFLLSFARLVWASDIQHMLTTWSLTTNTSSYPTSFTRDILPKPIHSHNDYWRKVPLYSAIEAGCISVEADVWEYGGELFIGHNVASLSRNRTFKSLYVDPLKHILKGQNPDNEFTHPRDPNHLNGVFDVDPGQTLHLFIDFKTPGHTTFPVVLSHLEALRSPVNYLTHFNGTTIIRRAVTVHMTGDAPFDSIIANKTYRDYFYDAPLADLASGKYTPENSMIASGQFGKEIGKVFWGKEVSKEQIETVKRQIREAHERGLMARYWDTPGWPISVRNRVWGLLVGSGIDLLNADDLKVSPTSPT